MHMPSIVTLGAFIVLAGAGTPGAQSPAVAPVPSSLEDQIALALRSNPDVLLAEAKVRQAQAELNAARLKVTQQVLAGHFEQEKQEQVMRHMEVQLEAAMQQVKAGVVSSDVAEAAKIALIGAKVALEQSVAQQRYLLGVGSLPGLALPAEAKEAAPAPAARRPEIPAALQPRLDGPVSLGGAADEQIPVRDVVRMLKDASTVAFILDQNVDGSELAVRSLPADVPLRSLLLAIADQMDGLCFVIRDYGILVTTQERAWRISGATIPPEVPYHGSERAGQ